MDRSEDLWLVFGVLTFLVCLFFIIILGCKYSESKDIIKEQQETIEKLEAQISDKDSEIHRQELIGDDYRELFFSCLESCKCAN